jgi:hypothetical protein
MGSYNPSTHIRTFLFPRIPYRSLPCFQPATRKGWSAQALGALWLSSPWYLLSEHKSFSSGLAFRRFGWYVLPLKDLVVRFSDLSLWFQIWSSCSTVESHTTSHSGLAKRVFGYSGFLGFTRPTSYLGFAPTNHRLAFLCSTDAGPTVYH